MGEAKRRGTFEQRKAMAEVQFFQNSNIRFEHKIKKITTMNKGRLVQYLGAYKTPKLT